MNRINRHHLVIMTVIPLGVWTAMAATAAPRDGRIESIAATGPMSLAEQQVEAQRLKNLCQRNSSVTRLQAEAKAGSMRASYEAAAALIQCYYDNVDSRYPDAQKQQWLQAIKQNKQQADQLR